MRKAAGVGILSDFVPNIIFMVSAVPVSLACGAHAPLTVRQGCTATSGMPAGGLWGQEKVKLMAWTR